MMSADPIETSTEHDFDLDISEDLIPSIPPIPSQSLNLDFGGILDPPLSIQTDETECGGKLWPAGMRLAEYLLMEKIPALTGKTMFVVRSDVSSRPTKTLCYLQ